MNIFLAQFLTLSLEKIGDFVSRRVGMIFFPILLLYLTGIWKTHFNLIALVFSGHIVCAFLVIIKYHCIENDVKNGYTTGFT